VRASGAALFAGVIALVASAVVSIDVADARKQPKGAGSGSAVAETGSAEPAAGSATPDEDEDEGSATHVVAPADGRQRVDWLRDRLAAAIVAHPKLAHAKLGIAVFDLATNQEIYAHDADTGLNLASNTKLLTSTAALATLGGGFRWRTAVYGDKLDEATGAIDGDLYVRGRGDPLLSVNDLRGLADDIAARGVRTVSGKLVVDGNYFDAQIEPPHYSEQPNEHAGFRAPVGSFGVARGTVTVIVTAQPGGPAKIALDPETDELHIRKHEVTTVTTGRTRIRVDAVPGKPHEIDVTGQIRAADGSFEQRRRLDEPARTAAEILRRELATRGVKIADHAYATGTVPAAAKLLATHDSAPLAMVVREMNKLSDNYVAETVLKTLGAETRSSPGPGTWADGTAAVRGYLGTIGIPANSYRADNGSGLFGASEVSAHQVLKILAAAYHDYRIGPDLVASLPVGGVDGTLAKRWHGSAARGRVRAKTGTLDKVIALAGYAGVDGAHQLAFVIVANDIPSGQRPAARAMADEMVDSMVAFLAP
jgi:D-alanyl-D-alanine carboxypeptidase/D-alanyl-D-alanine-endopeptidase (penicillin-binding protein 4)